ncbi:hypothetical protein LTR16_012787, partial [Cryomyces antarcticus]
RVLEIRIGVYADEVTGVDDGLVRAVHPRGPGVDMPDGLAARTRAGDERPDLADVVRNISWLCSGTGQVDDAGWRDAVEVLGTD